MGEFEVTIRAEDRTLVAERTYAQSDAPYLMWFVDEVLDFFGPEDAHVHLPPTWLDRLLARLP